VNQSSGLDFEVIPEYQTYNKKMSESQTKAGNQKKFENLKI